MIQTLADLKTYRELIMLRKSLFIVIAFISGCSLLTEKQTIGHLQPAQIEANDLPIPLMMHEQVRHEYRSVLALVEDESLRRSIERRIADIYMLEGDYNMVADSERPVDGYYGAAINAYNSLLKKYPNDLENEDTLYHLAKAYEFDGHENKALDTLQHLIQQYPQGGRIAEVYFRKGDIHFKRQEYREAELAYAAVTQHGSDSKFANNAMYLLGWTRYKQSDYDGGLVAFNQVLDRVVPDNGRLEGMSKVNKALAEDTLRIVSLSLSYAGGANKIKEIFSQAGDAPRYAWLLYSNLGGLYLEKERYEDSADAYRAFVEEEPESDLAPVMHAKMIRAYVDGDFPQQVMPEKERYVANYGIYSDFWRTKAESVKQEVLPTLKTYIDELARHYHGTAQKLAKSKKKGAAENWNAKFAKAASFYLQYIETFPSDGKAPDMMYMAAEASFDGGFYEQAASFYHKTAYEYKHPKQAANAGYAVIVSNQKLVDGFSSSNNDTSNNDTSNKLTELQKRSVDSKLQFVSVFPADKRSSAVMASASEELFALKDYQRALDVAKSIVESKTQTDRALSRTAFGVIAKSYFELGNLMSSEQAFVQQLTFIDDAEQKNKVLEKIAIIAYKQGEKAVEANALEEAVEHFLRVKQLAPKSKVRVAAQFDASTHLISMKNYARAIVELEELKAQFPKHKLSLTVPRKLAFVYEQDGQFERAASEYLFLYHNDADADVRREALFTAAELNRRLERSDLALTQFKKWAHQYEQPFAMRMEARFQIASIYEDQRDMNRHLYWLRRIIDADQKADDDRNERSMYLAAWANAKYGDYWTWEFNNVRLRNPLDKYLPRKQEKLKNAQERYEKAAAYGITEFTAKASYSIANLYGRFSQELINAPKPKGLSALEMEEYEMILEEQAIPFEDIALEIHQGNIERAWEGQYNEWVAASFDAMRKLNPIRFDKPELEVAYEQAIY